MPRYLRPPLPQVPNEGINRVDARREVLLEEYKEVGLNLRHFASARFAQLTVFIAATGFLLAAAFSKDAELTRCQIWSLQFLGIAITLVFSVLEYRSNWWWSLFLQRAIELEAELGAKQYTNRGMPADTLQAFIERGRSGRWRHLSASRATVALFFIVVVAWLGSLVLGGTACVA